MLANRLFQAMAMRLNGRFRQQAGSYKAVPAANGPDCRKSMQKRGGLPLCLRDKTNAAHHCHAGSGAAPCGSELGREYDSLWHRSRLT